MNSAKKTFFLVILLLLISYCCPQTEQLPQFSIDPMITQKKQQPATNDYADNEKYDAEVKRNACIDLVERGINYLLKNTVDEAFNAFTHGLDFVYGELYLFVYDSKGVCLAHGQDPELIWQDLWELRDGYGGLFVQSIIKKAQAGGGWTNYNWRNATKVSYVKQIDKDGKSYILGAGYYPHSKKDSVVTLVKAAVDIFDQAAKEGHSPESVFALISYPEGSFVLGDLYLYALDFNGKIYAQGDRPGLIGSSAWDVTDERGTLVNQEIIKKVQETKEGVWVEYISKRTEKHAYAEKVTDASGKNYFIACGYYPDANRKQVVDLVRQGFRFMKANGLSIATDEFNDRKNVDFLYGDLYLEVYTLKGKCLANGKNPDLVGRDFWDDTDETGKYYIRDLIKKAQAGGGWIDYKMRNLFRSAYAEKIDMGEEDYIITSGLYPISKRERTILLVKTAADYLRDNPRKIAFRGFVNKNGKFIRGDLGIFVFDFNGLCLAYSDDHNLIWRNLLNLKDDDGKAFVRLFINTAKGGAGKVSFRLNKAPKVAYVEPVEKEGKSYVVGSSYYT